MKKKKGRPLVFADRDGTLIHDIPYLSRLEDISLIKGVADAIRELNRREIPVVLVTNQSGVARGLFSESFILETHARLMELLEAEGATLQGLYYCPHLSPDALSPTGGDLIGPYLVSCSCRKPEPGMLLRAINDLGGDPGSSIMIGDADRDIEASLKAGCRGGYRILKEGEAKPSNLSARCVESFAEAVHHFLSTRDLSGEGS